ncbi:Planctomycete cytochrome C [Planctomycetes bacterium Pan216]|uniref:Planctomycete cytochrome C n=1 Tax=Kolteria novifilia TaxID=2527975 RepID=A0A518B405_9BACT|nr:Planctomycete cytochrome C [Planctomycetes bacterium Pan216]
MTRTTRHSLCFTLALAALAGGVSLGAEAGATNPSSGTIAFDRFGYPEGNLRSRDTGDGWKTPWKTSRHAGAMVVGEAGDPSGDRGGIVQIRGTAKRNNPLRRRLEHPVTADELFLRFRLRYDAASIDSGTDGEFFVMWLDDIDGSDGAHHNAAVPNIGVHTAGAPKHKQTMFMVRISSQHTAWTPVELEGDRWYTIVGRLWKSRGGPRGSYDRFSMWVDPKPDQASSPDATAKSPRGPNLIDWVGFATGLKTEPTDRIEIADLALGTSWSDVVLGARPVMAAQPRDLGPEVSFKDDVYPLLKTHCFDCHAGADSDSGIRLDIGGEVLGQSSGYPLVLPGKSHESPLFHRMTTEDDDERMPPDEALAKEEIALLARWIDQGAKWDETVLPAEERLTSDHWAFQRVERPDVPKVNRDDWVRTPVDAFILAEQERQGIVPAPTASPTTLARRLALDLTGLPPTPEEATSLADTPNGEDYDRLVEHYLSSPRHGERWGRFWLDLARWAETNGHQHNRPRSQAWRYRDYVIDSFNADKPYDQFLREQLAGDELQPLRDEHLVATGFLASARVSGNELDKVIQRNDMLVDVTNATASSLLGLTMECAQCHTHKFDPITARDYYRFQGFFVKGQPVYLVLPAQAENANLAGTASTADLVRARIELFETVRERLVSAAQKSRPGEEILIIRKSVEGRMKPEEKKRYRQLGQAIAKLNQAWGYYSPATSPSQVPVAPTEVRWPLLYEPTELAQAKPYLLTRGEAHSRGPEVDVGWPAVFGEVPSSAPIDEHPRRALADWLTSRDNPLTARVWANRIWLYHFGEGLVKTPSNFGVQTPEPMHRALLDWLACELMENGWSTKHLHRLIVQSNTYRQSSAHSTANASLDPDNVTYWRREPRRMEMESIRDSVLAVAGTLEDRVGGPSLKASSKNADQRRSIYLFQDRNFPSHEHRLFDGPSMLASCPQRRVSTVALQPLYLLNNGFALRAARQFAERVARRHQRPEDQVNFAFRLTVGRPPTEPELERCLNYLKAASIDASDKMPPLAQLCHSLLNLNEFLYIP